MTILMKECYVIEPRQLLAWLVTRDSDSTIGQRVAAQSCPLHTYLTEQCDIDGTRLWIDSEEIMQSNPNDYDRVHYYMTPFMKEFVRRIDEPALQQSPKYDRSYEAARAFDILQNNYNAVTVAEATNIVRSLLDARRAQMRMYVDGVLYNDLPAQSVGTFHIGSDSYAMHIIASTPKRITARYWGDDREETFTLRNDGRWRLSGARNYGQLSIGFARDYRDPSF